MTAAVADPTVRVPVREPVAVGEKTTLKKQEALGASGPLQSAPPVDAGLRAKSPVRVGAARVTAEVVRLVRVKRVGALVLWTGMVPKSCVVGLRRSPVRAMPVPVRVTGEGVPVEVRVTAAVCGPEVEGVNCTPNQQLMQDPVKVGRKDEVGGWPWP